MAGIYIHIPFCKQACHYCDFHFSTQTIDRESMVKAIGKELLLQAAYLGSERIETIYFGGGTPSLLNQSDLDIIFQALFRNFIMSGDVEITLEANPDDLSSERLVKFKNLGINRLSIGIQSFDTAVLKFLNRAHDGDGGIRSFENARNAGFNNISLDVIYAIPGQDLDLWKATLKQIVKLNPEHISAYSLTIEPRTLFGNWFAKGRIKPVGDDTSAEELELLINTLESRGYDHYEISNFGKPGYYSRHNTSYWQQKKYLGVGPSAHSYNGVNRQSNVSNNHQYLKSIDAGVIPCNVEVMTIADNVNDYLLTTLRTIWGCDLDHLRNEFNYDLARVHKTYLENLLTNQLAVIEKNSLKLTSRGKFLADKISSDLFFLAE